MSAETESVKAKFDVKCDRCGLLIRTGEDCQIIFDSDRGKAYFIHRRCPMVNALRKHSTKPIKPARKNKLIFA